MKFKFMTARIATAFALLPIFLLSMRPETVSARSARNGSLHVTKQCSNPPYTGAAGDSCTITSSNLAEIKVGSKVFYGQAFGIPAGLLDSNVVLDAGQATARSAVAHLISPPFSDCAPSPTELGSSLASVPVSMFPWIPKLDFSIGMERTASVRNLIEMGNDEQLKLVGND